MLNMRGLLAATGVVAGVAALVMAAPSARGQVTVDPQATPTAWDFAEVWPIVEELAGTARRVADEAKQRLQVRDRAQLLAYTDVATMADLADSLRTQLKSHQRSPGPTRALYRRLVSEYTRAKLAGKQPQFGEQVARELDRIGTLLDRLSAVYSAEWRYEDARMRAAEIEDSAAKTLRAAEGYAGSGDAADKRAMFLLQRLAESARHYAAQLAAERNPARTDADLRMLASDYSQAVQAVLTAGFRDLVRNDLDRIAVALQDLRTAYQLAWSWEETVGLAEQVNTVSQRLLLAATDRALPGGSSDPATVRDLAQLARAADLFRQQVNAVAATAADTQPEFLAMRAAYDRASLSFARAGLETGARPEFVRLGELLEQLQRMYVDQEGRTTIPRRLIGTPVGPSSRP